MKNKGMKRKAKVCLWLTGAAIAIAVVFWAVREDTSGSEETAPSEASRTVGGTRGVGSPSAAAREGASGTEVTVSSASSRTDEEETVPAADEPRTEEEKREAEEEKLVDAFDGLTDKWQEPSSKGVTMADVDNFSKQFRQVPKARRDECIHRALNLIPDENVMLLAGVLMDKTMDKEIVETVYNDILNRDEDVKKPILQQIFKDKTHPCWADTAWILDVTGELPKAR